MAFICPTQTAAEAIANSTINSFMYEFSYIPNWSNSCEGSKIYKSVLVTKIGSGHGMEIPFLFPTYFPAHPLDEQELELSEYITEYWTNFAKEENPNGGSLLKWPEYVFGDEENVVLNLPLSLELNYKETNCELWDELEPYLPVIIS